MKLLFALALFTVTASADQFQTVTDQRNSGRYEYDVAYPEFFSNSVPGYLSINDTVSKAIEEMGCGEPEDQEQQSYYYYARAKVIGLNQRYVGIEVFGSDYCGGAHPNHWTTYMTFDSNNGKALNISKEFGFKDYDDVGYDWEIEAARRKELAALMVDFVPADIDQECFISSGGTRDEKIRELADAYYPSVAGLAKGKKVVISTSVAHAMKPCEFSIRLSYEQVKSMLDPGSYLHTWLQ